MNLVQLQGRLRASGRYAGALDGNYGPLTRAAVLTAMTDGPDTKLTDADFAASAQRLGLTPAHIKAVTLVESAGAGFAEGRPVLLFEPHRFHAATNGRFDASHPAVSYSPWDRTRYPKTQAARYDQLLEAVGLDVDAGFASASYGRFQILGENFGPCGFDSSFSFGEAQAHDEVAQLRAFEAFIRSCHLVDDLKDRNWAGFARGYNGSGQVAYYAGKLADAYARVGGR